MLKNLFLLILLAMLPGCFDSPSKTQSSRAVGASSESSETPAVVSSTLAIGNDVINELQSNLVASGLTLDQANVITAGAKTSLNAQAGTLETGANLVEDVKPIAVACPAIIEGAIATLSDPNVNLGTADDRANVTKIIMSSTFSSLNGRTTDLTEDNVMSLTQSMVGSAVSQFSKAGLTGADAGTGIEAVMVGAVGSLAKAGITGAATLNVAQALVTKAVEKLPNSSADDQQFLGAAINKATYGAVSVINTVASSEDGGIAAVSKLTAASVSGLKALNVQTDQLSSTVQQICSGAVAALGKAQLIGANLGAALQSITQSSLTAINTSGFGMQAMKDAAGAVAGGAVAALSKAGVSEDDIAGTNLVSQIMTGAISGLSTTGVSGTDIASSMGNIVNQTVASLGRAGFANANTKLAVMDNVIAGAMNNFQASGITSADVMSVAMQGLSSGASSALANAGIGADEMSSVASRITQASVSNLNAMGTISSDVLTNIISNVTQGVVQGMGALVDKGAMRADDFNNSVTSVTNGALTGMNSLQTRGIVGANALANISGAIAGAAINGMTAAGVSMTAIQTAQNNLTSAMNTQLSNLGISGDTLRTINDTIATAATNSVSTAQAVNSGTMMQCNQNFPNSMSDSEFSSRVTGQSNLICQAAMGTPCPMPRIVAGIGYNWMVQSGQVILCKLETYAMQGAPTATAPAPMPSPTSSTTTSTQAPAPAPLSPSPTPTAQTPQSPVPGPAMIPVTNPVFSPGPGNYSTPISVAISTVPNDAVIRYTIDGSVPTFNYGLVYTGPVPISSSMLLQAIAFKEGYLASALMGGQYNLPLFGNQITSNSCPYPLFVKSGDMNGDGFKDLVIAGYIDVSNTSQSPICVSLGHGDGTFSPPQTFSVNGFTYNSTTYNQVYPQTVDLRDINNDGKLDITYGAFGNNFIGVFLNMTADYTDTITFDSSFDPKVMPADSNPRAVKIADLDLDGKLDVAVAIANGGWISVFKGNGDGTLVPPTTPYKIQLGGSTYPNQLVIADFNQDNRPDVAAATNNPNAPNYGTVSVALNQTVTAGSLSFSSGTSFIAHTLNERPDSIAAGDFNKDGKPDLVVDNYSTNQVSVLLNTTAKDETTPSFSTRMGYLTDNGPMMVAVGDVNNDGNLDIVTVNSGGATSTVSVLLGMGNGTFQNPVNYPVGQGATAVTLDNVSGVGLDIIVTNGTDNTVGVLLNTKMP